MGYSVFKFGAIYLDDEIQSVPEQPMFNGDIPSYDGKTTISIGLSKKGEGITWIKANGQNLLIADRVLLTKTSWEDLDKNGFITGKPVLMDGQCFQCRLLHVGNGENISNEWDATLDETGENNDLWKWAEIYFWGTDVSTNEASLRAVRGYHSARGWSFNNATYRYANVGFRPALEILPSDAPIPNINLDGIDFQLSSLPGGEGFCPILQPIQKDIFKDIPVGGKVRMYTLMENGCPIHTDESIKDPSNLVLTDRYFGDEYLVSWVMSNGVAISNQPVPQQGKC